MALSGTWKLTSSEGVAAFSKSIGISDEKIAENMDFGNPEANVLETLTVSSDQVVCKITIGGTVWRDSTLPVGKDADEPALDGRPAKHFITVSGNTMKRTQKGADYECSYNRSVDGDVMTVTMVGPGGATATRKYARA